VGHSPRSQRDCYKEVITMSDFQIISKN